MRLPLNGDNIADIGRVVSKQKVTVPPRSPSTPGRDRIKTVTSNHTAMNHVKDGKILSIENVEHDVEMENHVKTGE